MLKYLYGVSAFISGFALTFAAGYVEGYLAAMAIPRAYFAFFGREHEQFALAILGVFTEALSFFLLSLVWCWLTLRGAASILKAVAWYCLGGIVIGLSYTEMQSAVTLRTLEAIPNPPSLFAYLLRVLPQWLELPNFLAFPAGLLAAAALSRRSVRSDS